MLRYLITHIRLLPFHPNTKTLEIFHILYLIIIILYFSYQIHASFLYLPHLSQT